MNSVARIALLLAFSTAAIAQVPAPPTADPGAEFQCSDSQVTIDGSGLRLSGRAVPTLSDQMIVTRAGPIAFYAVVSVGDNDYLLPLHYVRGPRPKE